MYNKNSNIVIPLLSWPYALYEIYDNVIIKRYPVNRSYILCLFLPYQPGTGDIIAVSPAWITVTCIALELYQIS